MRSFHLEKEKKKHNVNCKVTEWNAISYCVASRIYAEFLPPYQRLLLFICITNVYYDIKYAAKTVPSTTKWMFATKYWALCALMACDNIAGIRPNEMFTGDLRKPTRNDFIVAF